MTLPLYQGVDAPARVPVEGHRGLWFARFFNGFAAGFSKPGEDGKKTWMKDVARGSVGEAALLMSSCRNLGELAGALGGASRVYQCRDNFVSGMGNAHPVENGFSWHPTLGVPYLPGSAVKGLVRSLVETALDASDAERQQVLLRWFGSTCKPGDQQSEGNHVAGSLIFFDALPAAPCGLKVEVMTPHMGKWYEKGGTDASSPESRPGDWHDPVPVNYLVANNISLQFCIAPRIPDAASDLADAWQALECALDWRGAGGKTAIGFGRFLPDQAVNAKREKEAREQAERQQKSAALAAMSEAAREVIALRDYLERIPVGTVKPGNQKPFQECWAIISRAVGTVLQSGTVEERGELLGVLRENVKSRNIQFGGKEKDYKAMLKKLEMP